MKKCKPSEVGDTPMIKTGITGNLYVYCKDQVAVEEIAESIGRSKRGVYFNHNLQCYALRVKQRKHKQALQDLERRMHYGKEDSDSI